MAKLREMNLHELPWPHEQLSDLGKAQVTMRDTLSYFVEPNPSSRGWADRYVYPSHMLRFDTFRPEESVDGLRKRINRQARVDGETRVRLATEPG